MERTLPPRPFPIWVSRIPKLLPPLLHLNALVDHLATTFHRVIEEGKLAEDNPRSMIKLCSYSVLFPWEGLTLEEGSI